MHRRSDDIKDEGGGVSISLAAKRSMARMKYKGEKNEVQVQFSSVLPVM
jgi:hypothetical protein